MFCRHSVYLNINWSAYLYGDLLCIVVLVVLQPQDMNATTDLSSLLSQLLSRYVTSVNRHVRQAACVWLWTVVNKCSQYSEIQSNIMFIQDAFISLLSEDDGKLLFPYLSYHRHHYHPGCIHI